MHMLTRLASRPLFSGVVVGIVFGIINAIVTWSNPLLDDNAGTLLAFYGPMFVVWALAAFAAARSTGRVAAGISTGALVAFATFCVFDVIVIVRVNVFLNDLTGRADWQNMLVRFQNSGSDNLRAFITLYYLEATPLKIAAASCIGALMGMIGGIAGRTVSPSTSPVRRV
jgi:hypothetical protein